MYWLVGVAVVVVLWVILINQRKGAPPGPLKLPVIGSLWAIGDAPHLPHHLTRLARKWGDMYSLQLGAVPVVVVSNPALIREMFKGANHNFIRRFIPKAILLFGNGQGLIFSHTAENWAILRKLTAPIAKSFPNGVPVPDIIQSELVKFVEVLDKIKPEGEPLHDLYTFFTRNIYLRLFVGESWSFDQLHSDPLVRKLCEDMEDSLHDTLRLADFFPALEIFGKTKFTSLNKALETIHNFYLQKKEARKDSVPATVAQARDFLDVVIIEERNGNLVGDALNGVVREFFYAATFTVSDTLDWVVIYLAKNQDVQEAAFQEVNKVLKGGVPTLAHQATLPYVGGVIKEAWRLRPPSPIPFHIAEEDCHVGGYFIKKDTIIAPNLFGVGNLESVYKNPERFDPTRWMGEGDRNTEDLMPFGYGPTICLGMAVARQETFLAVATLIQRYQFFPAKSNPNPDLSGEFGVVFRPKDWKTVVVRRSQN